MGNLEIQGRQLTGQVLVFLLAFLILGADGIEAGDLSFVNCLEFIQFLDLLNQVVSLGFHKSQSVLTNIEVLLEILHRAVVVSDINYLGLEGLCV